MEEQQQDPHILKEGTQPHPEQVIAGKSLDQGEAGKSGINTPAHTGGPLRIKLDGVVKTLSGPVTGASLHRLAGEIDGYPVSLKSGGQDIANDDKPVEVKQDQEFTTK